MVEVSSRANALRVWQLFSTLMPIGVGSDAGMFRFFHLTPGPLMGAVVALCVAHGVRLVLVLNVCTLCRELLQLIVCTNVVDRCRRCA